MTNTTVACPPFRPCLPLSSFISSPFSVEYYRVNTYKLGNKTPLKASQSRIIVLIDRYIGARSRDGVVYIV